MKRLGVFLQFTTWMRVHTGGNPAMDKHTIQAGAEILLAALCFRGRHKALRPRASWDYEALLAVGLAVKSDS